MRISKGVTRVVGRKAEGSQKPREECFTEEVSNWP